MTPAAKRRLLVSATLFLLPVVILAGAWRLGGVSALEDDLIYYLPIRQYIAERIRAGEWPLWNPLVAMGTSIAADPQSGLWYPLTALFLVLPPLAAYSTSLVLHFALAGAGMYRFLRASRHDWRAALLGAVAFEFCGYLVAHRAHLTIHHAAAWLPWMLYGWLRFAQSGRLMHAALASAAFGLQMLVQHIQISIISAALVTGYAGLVLMPTSRHRRALLWAFPCGMFAGLLVSGVQLLPTWLHYAGSVRGAPSYYLFNENAWLPRSGLMLLFPMIFGARTPNVWPTPWWGESHFCEQSAYGTLLVLVLAVASWRLAKRRAREPEPGLSWAQRLGRMWGWLRAYGPPTWPVIAHGQVFTGPAEGVLLRDRRAGPKLKRATQAQARRLWADATAGWRREPAFWWGACLAALLLALGDLTPLGKLLFHVPLYRSLRVPARWILVWSTAMPILASLSITVLLSAPVDAARFRRTAAWIVTRLLPAAAAALLILPVIPADGQRGFFERVPLARSNDPAIWWPVLIMMATCWALLRWLRSRSDRAFTLMFCVFLADLAAVAAFVDVDTKTYKLAELTHPPPLAEKLGELDLGPGDRLLVPRRAADYARPVEVLWPQYNLRARVATLNGYGPLGSAGSRMLFRFMPWGSSEEMLGLLRNQRLLRMAGVRFIAVRSDDQRALLGAAAVPDSGHTPAPIPGTELLKPVSYGRDLVWSTAIAAPGVYELSFDVEPAAGSPSRWFVRLETPDKTEVDWTRTIDPADMSAGRRRMRFTYCLGRPVPELVIRIKSEIGHALSAGRATLRRAADLPDEANTTGHFVHRVDLPGGISLYEVPGCRPLLYWAERAEVVPDLVAAIGRLEQLDSARADPEAEVTLVEHADASIVIGPRSGRPAQISRPTGHEIRATAHASGGLLVLNESHDPGWRAYVDGVECPVVRVNGVFQGVTVPEGRSEVRFIYAPPGLALGGLLSTVGTLAILCSAVWSGLRGRGRSQVVSKASPDDTLVAGSLRTSDQSN